MALQSDKIQQNVQEHAFLRIARRGLDIQDGGSSMVYAPGLLRLAYPSSIVVLSMVVLPTNNCPNTRAVVKLFRIEPRTIHVSIRYPQRNVIHSSASLCGTGGVSV